MDKIVQELLNVLAAGIESDAKVTIHPEDLVDLRTLACRHGLGTYVFAHIDVPADASNEVYAAWKAMFLRAVPETLLREQQLSEILAAFHEVNIPVVPLKGSWLSENVYPDPAFRTMSDMDILVPASEIHPAEECLSRLGYSLVNKEDSANNPYLYEVSYTHPLHPYHIELHWNCATAVADASLIPDIASAWENVRPGKLLNQPVFEFSLEDQLNHLAQHILHHRFGLPLRAYLDVALFIRKFGGQLTKESLDAAVKRWKTGRAVPFVLWTVREFFGIPLPPMLGSVIASPPNEAWESFVPLLLVADTVIGERSWDATLYRQRFLPFWERPCFLMRAIFCSRECVQVVYPWAHNPLLMPFAWGRRFLAFFRRYIPYLLSRNNRHSYRNVTALRYELMRWVLEQ